MATAINNIGTGPASIAPGEGKGLFLPSPGAHPAFADEHELLIKIDDHVGFIAAYFASPGLFLFFLGFTGWRLNVDPLAAYGHFSFIPAFFAHAYFDFLGHCSLLFEF
jgi:hypothetical protein